MTRVVEVVGTRVVQVVGIGKVEVQICPLEGRPLPDEKCERSLSRQNVTDVWLKRYDRDIFTL